MTCNNDSLLCYKCKTYLDIENVENLEIKWFEYGNYSQKKIKCKECGNWVTIKTIEDDSLHINYSSKYYEYNYYSIPEYKRLNEWSDYMKYYYGCNYDFKEYEYDYDEEYNYDEDDYYSNYCQEYDYCNY